MTVRINSISFDYPQVGPFTSDDEHLFVPPNQVWFAFIFPSLKGRTIAILSDVFLRVYWILYIYNYFIRPSEVYEIQIRNKLFGPGMIRPGDKVLKII